MLTPELGKSPINGGVFLGLHLKHLMQLIVLHFWHLKSKTAELIVTARVVGLSEDLRYDKNQLICSLHDVTLLRE